MDYSNNLIFDTASINISRPLVGDSCFTLAVYSIKHKKYNCALYDVNEFMDNIIKYHNLIPSHSFISTNINNTFPSYVMMNLNEWANNNWDNVPDNHKDILPLIKSIYTKFILLRRGFHFDIRIYPLNPEFIDGNQVKQLNKYIQNEVIKDENIYSTYINNLKRKNKLTLSNKLTNGDKRIFKLFPKEQENYDEKIETNIFTNPFQNLPSDISVNNSDIQPVDNSKANRTLRFKPIDKKEFNDDRENSNIFSDYLGARAVNPKKFSVSISRTVKRLHEKSPMDLLFKFPSKYKQVNNVFTNNNESNLNSSGNISIDIMRKDTIDYDRENDSYNFSAKLLGFSNNITVNMKDGADNLIRNYLFHVNGYFSHDDNKLFISADNIRAIKPKLISGLGNYTSRHGVPQEDISKVVMEVYRKYGNEIKDTIPKKVRKEHHLLPRTAAVYACHFPDSDDKAKQGQHTEKINELYNYVYKMQLVHAKRKRKSGFSIKYNQKVLKKFTHSLPYSLTIDQQNSVKDILYDLGQPYKMSRLLQGDVGSGKTVVAAYAVLATIKTGYQVALMIPTTILGGQHYETFTKFFKKFNVNIALLTGKTTLKQKRTILRDLKSGKIDMIIGTEALYQKKTNYKKLGLVVIDEQHRFGVKQRQALAEKTKGCNVLSMTATPIPRTLAITIFGDMDVSQIIHKPKGRKPIKTKFYYQKGYNDNTLMDYLQEAKDKHEQAFVVAKLVSPTSRKSRHIANAYSLYKHVKKLTENTDISVNEVDGRMDDNTKDKIINAFAKQKFDVLVATSVIEVGVDIPHANLMIIYNAEHYGLAQLHQLRGRVGRNSKQAKCILFGSPTTDDGAQRMQVMENTSDGFKVAQEDLKIRHSGNIFGRNQSGIPKFPLADLRNTDDKTLLQHVNQMASRVIRNKIVKNKKPQKNKQLQ